MNFDALNSLWVEYKRLEFAQRDAFYKARIWPLVKERFSIAPLQQTCDLSFHTVGTSAEPVILAALKLAAPVVCLLHTPETLKQAQHIQTELPRSHVEFLEVKRSEASVVYAAVHRVLETLLLASHGSIALEITSGTKAMVASLSMLAVALQARGLDVGVYYLENPRWDAELRRPEPGFEELVRLELPVPQAPIF